MKVIIFLYSSALMECNRHMLVFIVSFLFAAPYPATSSSAIVSENSYFQSKWGFTIHKSDVHWTRLIPDAKDPYHLTTYRPLMTAPDSQASLNIRVDPVSKRPSKKKIVLKSYLNYWLKQYPKLGMEVLKHEYTLLNGKKAVRVDAYNLSTSMQIRQYIVWEGENALLFSCSDKKDTFAVSLYACEQILQSMSWQDSLLPESKL